MHKSLSTSSFGRVFVLGLGPVLVTLGAGCAQESAQTCGEGLERQGNTCVRSDNAASLPTGFCGAGTVLIGGECLDPATLCGAGTTLVGGLCTPIVDSCGPGTLAVDGQCRLVEPSAPDIADLDDPTTPQHFELPTGEKSLLLGGVIDEPWDQNGDAYADADFGVFAFDIGAPTRLRIDTWSERDGQIAFTLRSEASETNGVPLYIRDCVDPNALGCGRELFLPRAGRYILSVTDYANLWPVLVGTLVVPVGGPDFIYRARLSLLGPASATPIDTLPFTASHDFGDGSLAYYEVSSLAARSVLTLAAQSAPSGGDIAPLALILDPSSGAVQELYANHPGADRHILLDTSAQLLLVHEFSWVNGPRRLASLGLGDAAARDCSLDDCSESGIDAGVGLYRWDLNPGDLLAVRLTGENTADAYSSYDVEWLAADFSPVAELGRISGGQELRGTRYATEATTVLLWITPSPSHDGGSFSFIETTLATPELSAGAAAQTGLHFARLPAGPWGDLGLAHVVGAPGDLVVARDFATYGVPTPRLELVGPEWQLLGPPALLDPDATTAPLVPALAVVPAAGHVLVKVSDAATATDLGGATFDAGADLLTPMNLDAPTLAQDIQTIVPLGDNALAALRLSGAAGTRFRIELRGEDAARQLGLWAFAPAYRSSWDGVWLDVVPGTTQQGLLGEAQGAVGEDIVLEVTVQESDVPHLLLLSDRAASPAASLEVRASLVPPPSHDGCTDAAELPLGISTTGQTRSALADLIVSDSACSGVWSRGPEVFYRVSVPGNGTLHVTLTPTLTAAGTNNPTVELSAYLFSACGSAPSCFAFANDSDGGSTASVVLNTTVLAGDYLLAIDGRTPMSGGDFEVLVSFD